MRGQEKLPQLPAAETAGVVAVLPDEHAAARTLGEFEVMLGEEVEEVSVHILEVSPALPGLSIHSKKEVVQWNCSLWAED